MNILLVEDDDVAAEAVDRAFRRTGAMVHRVKDGLEALRVLRGEKRPVKPWVVLLDLRMPRMNGIDFLDELRADDKLSATVVFVLSTSADTADIRAAYQRNIAGYIVKSNLDLETVVAMFDAYEQVVELPC